MVMDIRTFFERHRTVIVWIFRLIVGGTFIISGLAKMIDVWGSIYKIEQYLNVWGVPQPRSIVFFVALMLSGVEFILGCMLATGSYKRVSVWAMTALMAFMLPLTLYIAIDDPVPDCGCFGDFLVISNTATFLKNVLLVAMLVYLLFNNNKVSGLFSTYTQWLEGFLCVIYVAVIGFFGYSVQPLVDFRPYKVGTSLVVDEESDDTGLDIIFVYEKDGNRQSFSADNLPDSTWTFVDREIGSSNLVHEHGDGIAIYDGDDDVTSEVILDDGEQILLLIPEMHNIDISSTYLINEIERYIVSRGGEMIGVLGTNDDGLQQWRDLSMATYPLYTADDTSIKELARGNVAMVYLKDGIIQWKRTLVSIDSDLFASPDDKTLDNLRYSGTGYFWLFTVIFIGLELILWGIDRSGHAVKLHFARRNRKK